MHRATEGFARTADAYEQGRPGYPDATVDWLAARLGAGPVLDLAAGTGKLTRALAARGCDVVAVEPLDAMRAALAAAVPGVRALAGSAQAIPLPAGAVGAVTCAQAFHWFAGEEALAEIARVLRPAGRFAIVFNARDVRQPIQARLDELFLAHRGDTPSHESGAWRRAMAATARFRPVGEHRAPYEQELTRAGLVARIGSVSFIATLPAAERAAIAQRVAALAPDDHVVLRYVTSTFLYEREA
ncbi:MAG TPA: class I SAM-dependent methyltransferase [Thermomicrobiales bacterium]|nr:class I SAM-dependent methyltransferase [Thermomicrobiales bacterium]